MIQIPQSLMNELIEYYQYANTIPYLYNHYRELTLLANIAEQSTTEEIINTIIDRLANLEFGEDLVTVYGLVIALTFKECSAAYEALDKLSNQKVEWVGKLAAYSLERSKPTIIIAGSSTITKQRKLISPSSIGTCTSYSTLPKITVEQL